MVCVPAFRLKVAVTEHGTPDSCRVTGECGGEAFAAAPAGSRSTPSKIAADDRMHMPIGPPLIAQQTTLDHASTRQSRHPWLVRDAEARAEVGPSVVVTSGVPTT